MNISPRIATQPLRMRAWDRKANRMLYEKDFTDEYYFVLDFFGNVWEMSIGGKNEADVEIMLWAGTDKNKKQLFALDVVQDKNKKRWLIDWHDNFHGWFCFDFDNNEVVSLARMEKQIELIGNLFEGVKD